MLQLYSFNFRNNQCAGSRFAVIIFLFRSRISCFAVNAEFQNPFLCRYKNCRCFKSTEPFLLRRTKKRKKKDYTILNKQYIFLFLRRIFESGMVIISFHNFLFSTFFFSFSPFFLILWMLTFMNPLSRLFPWSPNNLLIFYQFHNFTWARKSIRTITSFSQILKRE